MNNEDRHRAENIAYDNVSRRVTVDWKDGHASHFAYIWLRHFCFFPTLGRPDQKNDGKHKIVEDPASISIESIRPGARSLVICWRHDGAVSKYDLISLRNHRLSDAEFEQRYPPPVHWNKSDTENFQWHKPDQLDDPAVRYEIFLKLRDYGIVLFKDIPAEPGSVEKIAAYFGPKRNTHFGTLFDIRSLPADNEGTGKNIGATASNAQAVHMDEGWRHGPPGLSFFHCLKSHPCGQGASVFVDGTGAAESLKKISPDSFELLTATPVVWSAERNPEERFRTRARLIATDVNNIVRGIRLSDRNLPPVDIADELVEPYYRALGDFCSIVYQKDREFEHLFQPGELAIFDNHRVLHSRRGFNPEMGERWIQQLSVDREEFHNVFRQLAESLGRGELALWEPDAGILSQR